MRFSRFSPRILALGVFGLSSLAITGFFSNSASSNSGQANSSQAKSSQEGGILTPSEQLAQQFSEDIDLALQKNQEAQSLAEWNQSGYTPRDIFSYARDLKDPSAWDALCQKLVQLKEVDLALFEEEISEAEVRKEIPCGTLALDRLSQYWKRSQKDLYDFYIASKQHETSLTFQGALPSPTKKTQSLLKSVEVSIPVQSGLAYERGNLPNGQIALTFDDGPHPTRSKKILNTLAASGVRATYFQIGDNAKAYPSISKEIANAGHIVGSHSKSHPHLPGLSLKEAERNIVEGRRLVAQAAGVDIPFFRFPYGAKNPALMSLVKSKNMPSFFWNMDTSDWKIRDPKLLYQNVLRELNREKGGIMLFHDVHEQTTLVLPLLLEELKKQHYSTVVFVPN